MIEVVGYDPEMFPFVLLRDDAGVKIINVKEGIMYDLLQERRVDCFSYLQYACLESAGEGGVMDLLLLEWTDTTATLFKYDLNKEIVKALKYIAFSSLKIE